MCVHFRVYVFFLVFFVEMDKKESYHTTNNNFNVAVRDVYTGQVYQHFHRSNGICY